MKTFILFVIAAAFLIEYSSANWFTDQTPACASAVPRVRRSWTTLTKTEKKQFAKAVERLKLEKSIWAKALGATTPLYDVFVEIHSGKAVTTAWHRTPFFLPAHKWFLWVYESCIQYVAYKYWDKIGLAKQSDACYMTLPYWDWTLDFDNNGADTICPILTQNPSGIFDADCFGDQYIDPTSYYVMNGIVYTTDWVTVESTGSNKNKPTEQVGTVDKWLKRRIECQSTYTNPYAPTFSIGPSQAMKEIVNRKYFKDMSQWVEATPHAVPHIFFGFHMQEMFSPDDPVFFLHHCNVDRLYAIWVDCQGNDKVKALTTDPLYYNNWVGTGYSQTNEIPYSWDAYETSVFPKTGGKWPTPEQLWSYGLDTPGYDGINYRYGQDQLVRGFGSTCPDKDWKIVDVGYKPTKKRDDSIHPRFIPIVDEFEAKLESGKTHLEALHEMAMNECENAPKQEFGIQWMSWINMMGMNPEDFDSICDKPSLRMHQINGEEQHTSELTATPVPLWLVIVASVGSALILIVVVTIVIIYVMKRKQSEERAAGSYVEM